MSKKIRIDPGWDNYKNLTFAPAVRKGNMLFITGMDPSQIDPKTGRPVVSGDIVEQTRVIYEKIKVVLEAAGASFEDVVWTTDYITTKDNYKATAEVRRQYFGESFPASTGIIVKGLLNDNALIEIDAVAVLD
jgi:enamine deaminase RidA (YjgF/YER057c/UK114 family)